MKAKIRSTVAVVPTPVDGMAFISREVVKFNYDLETGKYTPIIREMLFKEVEKPILDNDGNETGETEIALVDIKKHREFASSIINEAQVNGLFTAIGKSISQGDVFTDEYKDLIQNALLLETQGVTNNDGVMYGIEINQWVKV